MKDVVWKYHFVRFIFQRMNNKNKGSVYISFVLLLLLLLLIIIIIIIIIIIWKRRRRIQIHKWMSRFKENGRKRDKKTSYQINVLTERKDEWINKHTHRDVSTRTYIHTNRSTYGIKESHTCTYTCRHKTCLSPTHKV